MAMIFVNFDDWTKNTPEKQYEKAQKISKMVSKGKMPQQSEERKDQRSFLQRNRSKW